MITYNPLCPDCGGAMKLRTNKQTHEQFYGCTFYPECTGTRKAQEDGADSDISTHHDRAVRNDRNRWRNE